MPDRRSEADFVRVEHRSIGVTRPDERLGRDRTDPSAYDAPDAPDAEG